MASINKFMNYQVFIDKMQTALEEHRVAAIRSCNVIIKNVVVAINIAGPDPNELQESTCKFHVVIAKNRKEQKVSPNT